MAPLNNPTYVASSTVASTFFSLPSKNPRQVFVAYPYKLYPSADYRPVFKNLEKPFEVTFVFADDKISNLHILEKITTYIKESQFGIYDISGWNPNVTLELGIALGLAEVAYLTFDPSKTLAADVPADLRGLDRIQYDSYAKLSEGLEILLAQEFPIPPTHDFENQLDELRAQALAVVRESDGIGIGGVAKLLGISVDMAKVVVRPLLGTQLTTTGNRRGTKYILRG